VTIIKKRLNLTPDKQLISKMLINIKMR